jgi:hypothetical protein
MGGNLTKAPAGNTVDVANTSYTNRIGAPLRSAYWKDPSFDATQRAFYCVRVIQISTPRWTANGAPYFKVTMMPKLPMVTQERAFTSPIWYSPR